MDSSYTVFHNPSKFLPRAISGFHMNQSIRVPVFLPNLHSQPSGKLNFTHLDAVRTLAFFLLVWVSFASRAQNYLGEYPDCPWPFLTVCRKDLHFTSCVGRLPRMCCESGSTACLFQSSGSSVISPQVQNKLTWPLVQTPANCSTVLETSVLAGDLLRWGWSALCIGLPL